MKKVIVLLFMFAVSACNTIEGAGKDIEKSGENIQESSREVKQEMK